MQCEGIDMWIFIVWEYNEDLVFKIMLFFFWFLACCMMMLVIYDIGDSLEIFVCVCYDVGEVFKKVWDKEVEFD